MVVKNVHTGELTPRFIHVDYMKLAVNLMVRSTPSQRTATHAPDNCSLYATDSHPYLQLSPQSHLLLPLYVAQKPLLVPPLCV